MTDCIIQTARRRGSTLLEALIALGVIAVMVPLVLGCLVESGNGEMRAEAETRSSWIVPVCVAEIHASREGRSGFFETTLRGDSLPENDHAWLLGFSSEGELIGRVSPRDYDQGVKSVHGRALRYVVAMHSMPSEADVMQEVKISVEFPSAVKARMRRKLEFYTRLP